LQGVDDLVLNTISGSDASRLMLMLHGYGADERDLGALLPYLDPEGTFAVVLPRAPLPVPGTPGYAWYDFGDPAAGSAGALEVLDALVDEQCAALGVARHDAVFAGFSQGAGLALALGLLRTERELPAGVLAMSPAVVLGDPEEFDPRATDVPVFVAHGTHDPLIPAQQSRDLARVLRAAGIPTEYREYPMEHQVAMEELRDAHDWLGQVLAGARPDEDLPEDPVELVPSVTTGQFEQEVLRSETPVIVDFWAPWCGPCRQVSPVVETIAAMRQGSYKVVKVNIDNEPAIAQQYHVQSIPMIGLFRNGRLERASLGAKPRQQLEAELGMLVIP
jgi:thioredoxin 1